MLSAVLVATVFKVLGLSVQATFVLTSVGKEWDHVWQVECVFVVSLRDVVERPYLASCYDVTSGIVASQARI